MKIEVGKSYATAAEGKVEIFSAFTGHANFPFWGLHPVRGSILYTAEGKFYNDERRSPYDIVAEWIEPKTEEPVENIDREQIRSLGNDAKLALPTIAGYIFVDLDSGEAEFRSCAAQPADERDEDPPATMPGNTKADPYFWLLETLFDAYKQAAFGKGRDRHARGQPFEEQPIMTIGRMLSSVCDGELYQAIKKAQEASGMISRGELDAAERELLGGINYLAAAVLLIREQKEKEAPQPREASPAEGFACVGPAED